MPNSNRSPTPEQIAIIIMLGVFVIATSIITSIMAVSYITSTEAWYGKVDMHKLHGVNGFMPICVDEDFEEISTCDDCDFSDLEPTQICTYKYRILKDVN